MHINSVFTWGIEARPNGLSFSHDSDPFRPYDVENMTYSHLRIVRSGSHFVTYLDVDNFCVKRTEAILHETDSSKPTQSVSLIYELDWLADICKFEENLVKTSCKVATVSKVAKIFWWRHDNRK